MPSIHILSDCSNYLNRQIYIKKIINKLKGFFSYRFLSFQLFLSYDPFYWLQEPCKSLAYVHFQEYINCFFNEKVPLFKYRYISILVPLHFIISPVIPAIFQYSSVLQAVSLSFVNIQFLFRLVIRISVSQRSFKESIQP